jgi:hypothetical protein
MDLAEWDKLRRSLRDLHRALVERASRDYVYAHERLTQPGPAELLQMLTKDVEFNWLRGLSELIVDIDVARDDDGTRDDFSRVVRAAVERFISPPSNAGPRTSSRTAVATCRAIPISLWRMRRLSRQSAPGRGPNSRRLEPQRIGSYRPIVLKN